MTPRLWLTTPADVAARPVGRPASLPVTSRRCAEGSLLLPGAIKVTLDGTPASLISYGPDNARVFEAIGCGTGSPTSLTKATLNLD